MKWTRDGTVVGDRSSSVGRGSLRNCRRLARHLPLPEPWSVEALCTQVASARSRPIVLLDRPAGSDSITAALIATEGTDYIFCRADLRGLHRDHAICHELGHLLARHRDLREFAMYQLLPGKDGMTFRRDCDYGADREREAEAIADVIMGRVVHHLSPRATPSQRVLRGFDEALR